MDWEARFLILVNMHQVGKIDFINEQGSDGELRAARSAFICRV